MKGKIPFAKAKRVAWDWRSRLQLDCKRIEIAGSVRRECETVGDIELVAIPRPSLFGKLLDLKESGGDHKPIHIMKGGAGLRNGRARYIQIYDQDAQIHLDLFLTTPEKWGVIFTIRTGSAEFSHALMVRANQLGLTSKQGRLVPRGDDSAGFRIPLETPEERDVFKALNIKCPAPYWRRSRYDIEPLPSTLRSAAEDGS